MDDFSREPHLRLEMLSQARFLASVRALIGSVTQRLGFNEIHAGQISLAVDEALCNVINHGYEKRGDGRIWINIWAMDGDPAGIQIVIEDRAKQVEPAVIRSRDLEDIRPGGLGVYIIREIMDEARYEKREGGGMRLTLTKRIPDSAESARSSSAESRPSRTKITEANP